MKKTIFSLTVIVIIAGLSFISCHSSTSKVDEAKDNLEVATENVAVANQALKESIDQFRITAKEKIMKNEKNIAELKIKIANEKMETKRENEKKLAELEEKNNNLTKKLNNYNDVEEEKWESFKIEYNHDMDELGEAFKDFTIKNVK